MLTANDNATAPTRGASTACRCCGRPLTDPVSVEVGIGPVCRAGQKAFEAERRDLFTGMTRSQYTVETVDGVICVVDLDRGGRSVTNDAAGVARDLLQAGILTPGQRLVYRDSLGIWDELVLDPRTGAFQGFAPIQETDRSRALLKIRQRAS